MSGSTIKKMVIFTTNSFRDPLFYSTVITYLREINKEREYEFHVVSFEQEKYAVPEGEVPAFRDELNAINIIHYPHYWKQGGLLTKLNEFLRGYRTVKRIRKKENIDVIFALANIAGAFAYIMSRRLKMKCIIFTYEPHSEFMRDCGVWKENGMRYRLLHHYERKMGMNADYIATGTQHMIERLKAWGTKAKTYRVPSCVDEDRFVFDAQRRTERRKQLNAENKNIYLYLGKFGDLYYRSETITLFVAILKNDPDAFFLVITPNSKEEIEGYFRQCLIPDSAYYVTYAEWIDVPGWISAADMGVIAVPPLASQKFRSPIKAGEYLCCGLPYIVCRGISEDDLVAEKSNVGIVIDEFTAKAYSQKAAASMQLLQEDKDELRKRCRTAGIAYRSKQIAINAFTEIFHELY